MTHEGPQFSSTAKNHYFCGDHKDKTFLGGNSLLRDLMISNKSKVVCNIHGHTHDGSNYQNIYKPREPLPTINPGSLTQGEFGQLVLTKGSKSNRWRVESISKHFLDCEEDEDYPGKLHN